MSKMGLHCPFGHLKHKSWSKERPRVKLAIWLPTTKSQESTRFPCVQATCDIPLENFWRGLQLCFRPHCNQRSVRIVMGPKVVGVLVVGILGLPLGTLKTKCHLDVALVKRRRKYCKGEGGDFPQVRVVVNLVSPNCSWFVLAPKVFQLCTNHLVLVLCRSMWVSEAYRFFLVPSWSSSTPLYPLSSVVNQGVCLDSLLFRWFVATPLWAKCEGEAHTPKSGKLESHGTPESSELNCRGQIFSHLNVPSVIRKVLKCRCPKWPHIGHLDICSPSYGQKKGRESNWQFDSWPLKVGNRPVPNVRSGIATWRWKTLFKGYKLV
jgi:hypothetical protein